MDIEEYKTKLLPLLNEFGDLPGRTRHDKTTAFFHLSEELGEVGEQMRHELQNPKKFSTEHLAEELADVIRFATLLTHYYDIDISDALQANLDKLRKKIDAEKQ